MPFDDDSFAPGAVIANQLHLLDRPPYMNERTLLWVEFPNAVALFAQLWVKFLDDDETALDHLNISLYQGAATEILHVCHTRDEFERRLQEMTELARSLPSIRRPLYSIPPPPFRHGCVVKDELVLDPLAPLSEQLDALRPDLLVLRMYGYVLAVDWLPPHDLTGSFRVRLIDAPIEAPDDVGVLTAGEVSVEKHPATIAGLRDAIQELCDLVEERRRQGSVQRQGDASASLDRAPPLAGGRVAPALPPPLWPPTLRQAPCDGRWLGS